MAYCVQCGSAVGDADQYCGKCGTRQRVAAPPPILNANPFGRMSNRSVSLLCYVPWLGWIASIVVLGSDYFRREDRVRFHAFQGLYLFAAWLLLDWFVTPLFFGFAGFGPMRLAGRLAKLAVVGAWVFMLVRVNKGEDYHLPLVGELAEKSVSEQRM